MLAPLIGLWFALAEAQEGPKIEFAPALEVLARGHAGYSEGLSTGLLHGNHVFTRARAGIEMSRGTVSARVVLQHTLDWQFISAEQYPPEYARVPPRLDLIEGIGRIQARVPGGIELDITFGRMLFTLNNGRLISENDWLVAARPLDGLHVDLHLGTFRFQYLHFRDFSDFDALQDPGSFLIALGSQRENPAKSHKFDFIVFTEYVETDLRFTVGPYYERQSGRFDMTLEGYFQVETFEEAPADNNSTFHAFLGARAGWTFGPDRLVHTVLGYDLASAPVVGGPVGFGGWTAPLGDVYSFYGHMNLFQRPEDTDRQGLMDLSLSTTFNPRPRLQLGLDVHQFWTASIDAVALGFEADGTARLWFAPFASAMVGYSVFLASPGLATVTPLRGPFGSGWLQLGVEF